MARHYYTDDEIDKIAKHVRAGLSDTKIAEVEGLTVPQVSGLRHRLKDGTPHLFGNCPFTDWDMWL